MPLYYCFKTSKGVPLFFNAWVCCTQSVQTRDLLTICWLCLQKDKCSILHLLYSYTNREDYIHLIYIQRTLKCTSSRHVTEGIGKPTYTLAMQRLCYLASKSLIFLLSYGNCDNDLFMTVDPNWSYWFMGIT